MYLPQPQSLGSHSLKYHHQVTSVATPRLGLSPPVPDWKQNSTLSALKSPGSLGREWSRGWEQMEQIPDALATHFPCRTTGCGGAVRYTPRAWDEIRERPTTVAVTRWQATGPRYSYWDARLPVVGLCRISHRIRELRSRESPQELHVATRWAIYIIRM